MTFQSYQYSLIGGDYVTLLRGRNFPQNAQTIRWKNQSETVLPWLSVGEENSVSGIA